MTDKFKVSVDRYICIELDENTTDELVKTVANLPGTPIKKLHVTIVHSIDAGKSPEAMKMWNQAIQWVGHAETIVVSRYKQHAGVLTAAEALLQPDLAQLVASKTPHISLRLEKGHKAVESRFTLQDDSVPWITMPQPVTLKGTIKLMGRQ